MTNKVVKSKLLSKQEVAPNIFDYVIEAKDGLVKSKAGQFIHIKCGDAVFLRRPISICEVKENTLRFLFEVRGKGTDSLSKFEVGETIDLLGPLGRGFGVDKKYKNPVVIGGGIGIYPLLQVSNLLHPKAILGFRNKELVTLEEDFKKVCKVVSITTDDGSYGTHGLVTDVLLRLLEKEEVDAIFACGPMPMLSSLKKIAEQHNIYLEVSLEERMGCGVGACLCCATKVKDSDLEEGFTYSHVCSVGPVFNAKEVMFS